MQDIYRDGHYKDSNPTWHEDDAPWKARQIESILRANDVPFETVCEVGCGSGEILVQLSESFQDAVFEGYDISPQAHEIAVSRQRPRVSFSNEDIVTTPDRHFDLVLAIDVVEHVEDCFGFARQVRQLGDRQVFHIPLDISAQSVVRMWPVMNLRANVGHIHYFTKDTALAFLRDCGYAVLDWRYTASRLELPNQGRSSRLVAPFRRWFHRLNPDLSVRILGGYSLLVLTK
jgi:hypothetical protein